LRTHPWCYIFQYAVRPASASATEPLCVLLFVHTPLSLRSAIGCAGRLQVGFKQEIEAANAQVIIKVGGAYQLF
jgi:hypothetical protein